MKPLPNDGEVFPWWQGAVFHEGYNSIRTSTAEGNAKSCEPHHDSRRNTVRAAKPWKYGSELADVCDRMASGSTLCNKARILSSEVPLSRYFHILTKYGQPTWFLQSFYVVIICENGHALRLCESNNAGAIKQ